MSSTEELPQAGDIEVEYDDLYRQDEEQAYVTLMSQEVASLNFAAEANYTVRLCKEIVHFHNPEEMPMGSFELIASNKVWLPPPALPAAAITAQAGTSSVSNTIIVTDYIAHTPN